MKKTHKNIMFHILGIMLLSVGLNAQPVTGKEAITAARNFMNSSGLLPSEKRNQPLNLRNIHIETEGEDTLFYAVNFYPGYFVLISSDKSAFPVIGCSAESYFNPKVENPGFQSFMQPRRKILKELKRKRSATKNENYTHWERLLFDQVAITQREDSIVNVGDPLLKTFWGQGGYYNDHCPEDPEAQDGQVPVGCVAVAIGQILNYFKYPDYGSGHRIYDEEAYGMLSANFGETHYDWLRMENILYAPNNHVARLLYHCGIAVDMDYSPDGSGSNIEHARAAFDHFFRFNNPEIKHRGSYSSIEWQLMIKEELDQRRPVYYRGINSEAGHAWVCDGYSTFIPNELIMFHMNWGWYGNHNGWFFEHILEPGDHNYNDDEAIIVHLVPEDCTQFYYHTEDNPLPRSIETSIDISASATISPEYSSTLLDAGWNIHFLPGAWIKSGSTVVARIEGCRGASEENPRPETNNRAALEISASAFEIGDLQVYPNPFSTSTTLSYSITEPTEVDLQIFNATGTLIANPVQQQWQESGNYQHTFEAKDLPNGIYWVVLQKNGERTAKRVVLTR